MNYTEFRNKLNPFAEFTVQEIRKYFPKFDTRRLVEWQRKGYITKLRNGYYCFTDQTINEQFLFYTANQLCRPSYVSLETALSYYGFIPEGVFQITSCTTLKTQSFKTPYGSFAYRHIKASIYFGYQLIEWSQSVASTEKSYRFTMASPEKTLIDYLYLNAEVKDTKDIEALRWNRPRILETIDMRKLELFARYIGSPALDQRLTILRSYLNATT